VAAEAVTAGGVPTPGATEDLGASAVDETSSGVTSGLAEGELAPGGVEDGSEDEESDWEFNHEPPADLGADAEDDDFDGSAFGSVDEAGISGLDLDNGDDSPPSGSLELASDVDASIESAEEGESDFGGVDDLAGPLGGEPGALDDGVAVDASAGEEDAFGDVGLEEELAASEDDAGAEVAVTDEDVADTADELGEPESWDLFGDDSLDHNPMASPPVEADAARTAIGRTELVPQGSLDAEIASEAASKESVTSPHPHGAGEHAPPALWRSFAVAGNTVGWAATASLALVALTSGLFSSSGPMVSGERSIEVAGFRAQDVKAEWVDTLGVGTLLVVSGQLESLAARTRVGDSPLQVVLLAADGSTLDIEPAPLGRSLSESDLRELPSEELWRARDDAAEGFAEQRVSPGQPSVFQALFADVPDTAMRMDLTSMPGGQ